MQWLRDFREDFISLLICSAICGFIGIYNSSDGYDIQWLSIGSFGGVILYATYYSFSMPIAHAVAFIFSFLTVGLVLFYILVPIALSELLLIGFVLYLALGGIRISNEYLI